MTMSNFADVMDGELPIVALVGDNVVQHDNGEIVARLYPVRTKFNTDFDVLSRATGLVSDVETMTKQSFRDECDINEIVRRFNLTGQIPDNARAPQYVDFEGVFDFQTAMNTMIAAEEGFNAFPAETREFFGNDPQRMMEFVANGDNRDKAIELGLIPKPKAPEPEPAPMRVVVVPGDAPAAP